MKKENIKVGMFVKVKSRKKCEELGFEKLIFDWGLCGNIVQVVETDVSEDWSIGNFPTVRIKEKCSNYRQYIPCALLKKLKEDSNEQQ